MLGRVYYNQDKFEEATFELAQFNGNYPADPRFQKSTLLIAEAVVNFANKKQACDILKQSLEFMQNQTEKFKTRLNYLINEKQCSSE
jgi:TolA-binding protein